MMGRGYELPISDKEEDHFDRWRLATEIWGIVSEAPPDWSVRVGVYGKWGEGKTSILKFINTLAIEKGHVVVWFNPWSIRDKDTLWSSFASQLFAGLSKAGIEIKGSKSIKAKKWAKKSLEPIKRLSELHTVSKAIVGGALSILNDFFDVDGESFKAVLNGLGQRRLIVIIDDLDRSNPKLLPELLLSLREVMDLPRMSFILAFDVNIVSSALASEYSAWGRGEEFLEKIIDFPVVLPTPSESQVKDFIEFELSNKFSFVDRNVFDNIFDALPKNPRKIKLLLRYLWALKKQIERHDEWELDWNTIILWQLIKIESAHFSRLFSENKEAIDILSTWRFYLKTNGNEESEEHVKLMSGVKEMLSKVNIDDSDPRHERILLLVMMLGEKNSLDSSQGLLYQINLLDRPHSITWKEFDELFELWFQQRDVRAVNERVLNQSELVSTSVDSVANELWSAIINYRSRKLEDASSAISLEKHNTAMNYVTAARLLAEELYLNGLMCVGDSFFRRSENFSMLWNLVNTWIHFRKNDADVKERVAEEETLLKFVQYSDADPLGI